MTPAQLSRKRALDRASQRVTRARAREHIQRLEREVYELRLTTAAEPNGVDHILQELHLRNQALRAELIRLQRLAAAGRRAPFLCQPRKQEMRPTPLSPIPRSFDTEMGLPWHLRSDSQSQSRAHNIYQYNVPNSTISMNNSAVPEMCNTQLARTIPARAVQQQPEWLVPDLWDSSVASFSIPDSGMIHQAPQQRSPPQPHGFGCTGTQEIISPQTPTSEAEYTGLTQSKYTSMGLQQVTSPLDWVTSDTGSNTPWQ